MITLVLRDIVHHTGQVNPTTATTALTCDVQSSARAMDVGSAAVDYTMGTPWIALSHCAGVSVPACNLPSIWKWQEDIMCSSPGDMRIGSIQSTVLIAIVQNELPRKHWQEPKAI